MSKNSFNAKTTLQVSGKEYEIFDITNFAQAKDLPFSLKILLENLLRTEDGANITAEQIKALAAWDPATEPDTEIQFTPARVIMQDFTGVPCIVDLATMREAIVELGGDPAKVNPLSPAELVIDHSLLPINLVPKILLNKIPILSINEIKSVIAFFVGDKPLLMNLKLFHQELASCTR